MLDLNFSNYVEDGFIQAGWTPDRRVSTTAWENNLKKVGITLPKPALDFLVSFGGLEFTPPVNQDGAYCPEKIYFDPWYAVSGLEDCVEIWEQRAQRKFYPLGEVHGCRVIFVMTDKGEYSGISDIDVRFYGSNLSEAFEVLIRASSRPVIKYDLKDYLDN